jgi:ABC-type nitrate/sulfonate/bicarbonate transport system permease component
MSIGQRALAKGREHLSPDWGLKASSLVDRFPFREHRANLTRGLAVLIALGAWELLARSGAVSPLFFSSPRAVALKLWDLFSTGVIWVHILVSGQEALFGLTLAVAVGVPIGVAMGRWETVRHTLDPFVMAKYCTPTVALLPLLIIWLGIGLWAKVVLVFLGAVIVVVVNTEAGVASTDRRLIETARAFKASEWQILTKVIMPSAMPFLLAGLRLAVGRVMIMVVVAELYASTAGLGYLIFQGAATYDATLVFAGVTILAGTGVAINQALRLLERRLAPWRRDEHL